jgi:hypothetical protein
MGARGRLTNGLIYAAGLVEMQHSIPHKGMQVSCISIIHLWCLKFEHHEWLFNSSVLNFNFIRVEALPSWGLLDKIYVQSRCENLQDTNKQCNESTVISGVHPNLGN